MNSFINMKGYFLNNINRNFYSISKKRWFTSIARISLCNSCQKPGNGLGLANARPAGSAKFANDPPPGLTRRANAQQYPGGGGLGAGGIDWCFYKVTQDLSLICICKQKTFSPVLTINSSQKDKAFNYLLKLPNRTSSQFFVYFGNSLLD